MRIANFIPPVWLLVVGLCLSTVAGAAESSTPAMGVPKDLVVHLHAEINSLLEKAQAKDMPRIHGAIQIRLEEVVDFEAFARLALKRYFDRLSKKEMSQYLGSFRGLVQAAYLKRIKPGASHWIKARGEEFIGDRAKISVTVGSGGSEFDVDYLLRRGPDDTWRIYDIWIDDVSMARNYRSQFYRIYKSHGLDGDDGLIQHMERRQVEQRREQMNSLR
jgi:phospholipid transport system substrate-binding protein